MSAFLSNLKIAWRNLLANKMRSLLTLLGMIIGVAAVMSIVSLGEGLKLFFASEFTELGNDVIYIMPKEVMRSGQIAGEGGVKNFTIDDVDALKRNTTLLSTVQAGMRVIREVNYKGETYMAFVEGGDPDYFNMPSMVVEHGEGFTQGDMKGRKRVAVIGAGVRKRLFPSFESPLGHVIKIGGSNFTVIGVLKQKGGFGGGPSEDDFIIVPLTTMYERITGTDEVFYILARVKDITRLEEAKAEVNRVLAARRHLKDPTKADYELMTPADWMEFGTRFVNILVMVFGAVAVVSLLVGGIGIMNIMLVTVTERTREIGLRMALGAGRVTVLGQFLLEAVVLTLLGGVIGLVAGWGLALVMSALLTKLIRASWTPAIPVNIAAIALLVSIGIGVVFGVYPAYRASQLDPIEALRYE